MCGGKRPRQSVWLRHRVYVFHFLFCAVALLNFTRPFFEVSESEGLDGVCVRLELPRGGAMSQPVTFRTLVRQLSDKRAYINTTERSSKHKCTRQIIYRDIIMYDSVLAMPIFVNWVTLGTIASLQLNCYIGPHNYNLKRTYNHRRQRFLPTFFYASDWLLPHWCPDWRRVVPACLSLG